MVTAYYTEINALPGEQLIKQQLNKLTSGMKEKILTYHSRIEQLSRLYGKLLLSKLLSDNGSVITINDMKYHESGKPYLDGNFYFNIAHSGNIVICIGTQEARVGVDIERNAEIDINMMQDYFTVSEWGKINCSNNRTDTFYKLWVRKEACVKATGKGSFQPLNEIDVCEQTVVMDNTKWYLHDIFIKNGYSACIATDKNDSIKLIDIDITTLINNTVYDT